MAMMDPRIILAGQQPDIVNTLQRSAFAAGTANQVQHQNALRNLYQTQGPGIMAGDPDAMNAFARLDPMAGYDMQRQRAGDQREAESHKIRLAEYAKGLSREQAAAQAAEIEAGLKRAIPLFQAGDLDGINQLLTSVGEQPISDLGQFPAVAALYGDALDVLKEVAEFSAGPEPDYVMVDGQLVNRNAPNGPAVVSVDGLQPKGPEWRPATPDEAAKFGAKAGQINTKTGKFDATPLPKSTKLVSDGQGGFTFIEGTDIDTENPSVGDVYNPAEVEGTIALIDEIAGDPMLERVTGPIEGGGGNDVDQLNPLKRAYYGDKGLALIQKIAQLQSRSWLAARAMLKGGGPITDYESRKAEAAVARLSRAQGEPEFKAALKDLGDAIGDGLEKLRQHKAGGADQQVKDSNTPEVGVTEDGYRFLGGDPGDAKNWEKVR